jgi:hypothetical protein
MPFGDNTIEGRLFVLAGVFFIGLIIGLAFL